MQAFVTFLCWKSGPETGNESNTRDVISRVRQIDTNQHDTNNIAQCRRLYSDISVGISDSSDSSEYVFGAYYMPYEDEPLNPQGDDIIEATWAPPLNLLL